MPVQRRASIRGIKEHLPAAIFDNETLSREYSFQTPAKILAKTGVNQRRISAPGEFSSDLGVAAANKLFESGICSASEVEYLIFCTETPDYPMPATACVMQERLGLRTSAGAIDVNLGCSGFVYSMGLATALIESGQVDNALVITADTLNKYMKVDDSACRAIIGDGSAATYLTLADTSGIHLVGPWRYGTDGGGAKNLIVRDGLRGSREVPPAPYTTGSGEQRVGQPFLMNGPEIFAFTLRSVPNFVLGLLKDAELGIGDIDLWVLHQANSTMLQALRQKLAIPEDRYVIDLEHQGNTSCASIPIALSRCIASGRFRPGMRAALIGFGVGYSWGGTVIHWPAG